jgi:hypothetical protein
MLPSKNGFDHKISPRTKLSRALGCDPTLENPHIKHLRTYGCMAYVLKKGASTPAKAFKMQHNA